MAEKKSSAPKTRGKTSSRKSRQKAAAAKTTKANVASKGTDAPDPAVSSVANSAEVEAVLVSNESLKAYHDAQEARFSALETEVSSLRKLSAERAELSKLQALAIVDLEAKREAAEAQRAALSSALRVVHKSLVWRFAGIVRVLGRRLGVFARLSARFFEGLYAVLATGLGRRNGQREKRHGIRDEDRAAILSSGLFDEDWYRETYKDVVNYKGGALEHFLLFAASESRNPNPVFDTAWYMAAYPEVVASGRNPLAYYALYGIGKKHSASARFDTHWYATQNSEHLTTGVTPLQHFLHAGQWLRLPTQPSDLTKNFEFSDFGNSVKIPEAPRLPVAISSRLPIKGASKVVHAEVSAEAEFGDDGDAATASTQKPLRVNSEKKMVPTRIRHASRARLVRGA